MNEYVFGVRRNVGIIMSFFFCFIAFFQALPVSASLNPLTASAPQYEYSNGIAEFTAVVENNSSSSEEVFAVIGAYNSNDVLTSVSGGFITVPANGSANIDKQLIIPENLRYYVKKIKYYLWDSKSLAPILSADTASDPDEKDSPVENPYIDMNYKTMNARFSCNLADDAEKNLVVSVKSPSNDVIFNKILTADANNEIDRKIELTKDAETGIYTLSAYPVGEEENKTDYKFAYMGQRKAVFDDIKGIEEEHSIEILSQLGILAAKDGNSFKPEDIITKAELSAMLSALLAENPASIIETALGDVSDEEHLTFNQVVRVLSASLGYNEAEECGVNIKKDSKGLPFLMTSANYTATRATVAQLLANTLRTEIKGTGTNLLNEKHEAKMNIVRMDTAKEYGDNLLTYCIDRFGAEESPVFISGIRPETYQPFIWRWSDENGKEHIMQPANFTSSQNPMRVLVALTELTGDAKYKKAAADNITYVFENLTDSRGLVYSGGHWWQDSFADTQNGEAKTMEFKDVYPYYEFMYEVNPAATEKYIKAIWNSLVSNWSTLEITRHGSFDKSIGSHWNSSFSPEPPLSDSQSLTFLNVGADLMYAGAMYTKLTGDSLGYTWAERMYKLYADARHPDTNIIPAQYTQAAKNREIPEEVASSTNSSLFTTSYGDRAKYQFSEFGDVALEAYFLNSNYSIATKTPRMWLSVYNQLGASAQSFYNWTIPSMSDYIKYAYNEADHTFSPIFADGTSLDGYELQRNGYYGPKGTVLKRKKVDADAFLTYCRGYAASCDSQMWKLVRNIGLDENIGDIGTAAGVNTHINFATDCNDPQILMGVTELYNSTKNTDYLKLAKAIGNNIVFDNFINGFPIRPNGTYIRTLSRLDDPDPMALVLLQGTIADRQDKMPIYVGGQGQVEGPYLGVNNDSVGDDVFFNGKHHNGYE